MNGTSESCEEMQPVFPEAGGGDVAELETSFLTIPSLICFLEITHVMMISLRVVTFYKDCFLYTSHDS